MPSYQEILKLSFPIMVGSAVQNLITLTDAFFLGRVGETEFAAIGLVGVFYLLITSVGYSFSKAGQIMVARRIGQKKYADAGFITHNMWAGALVLATFMFLFLFFGAEYFFSFASPSIYEACLDYLAYRSYGVFFNYGGVIIVALYTGVARTTVLIYNALAMVVVNTMLNYALIFGAWGFPEQGIAGAGLASTLSEVLAFSIFLVYLMWDKRAKKDYLMWTRPRISLPIIKKQIALSTAIILQSIAGVGSWFIFFAIIESMGETPLAVSNMIRTVYLLFMIPCWGFASGVNTIVSRLIGQGQKEMIMKAVFKTASLGFIFTMLCALSIVVFPEQVLGVNTDNPELIEEAKSLIGVLVLILAFFSIGAIYTNALVGTGATYEALLIQIISVLVYLTYVIAVKWFALPPKPIIMPIPMENGMIFPNLTLVHSQSKLYVLWLAEAIYWLVNLVASMWYLKTYRWLGKSHQLFGGKEEEEKLFGARATGH